MVGRPVGSPKPPRQEQAQTASEQQADPNNFTPTEKELHLSRPLYIAETPSSNEANEALQELFQANPWGITNYDDYVRALQEQYEELHAAYDQAQDKAGGAWDNKDFNTFYGQVIQDVRAERAAAAAAREENPEPEAEAATSPGRGEVAVAEENPPKSKPQEVQPQAAPQPQEAQPLAAPQPQEAQPQATPKPEKPQSSAEEAPQTPKEKNVSDEVWQKYLEGRTARAWREYQESKKKEKQNPTPKEPKIHGPRVPTALEIGYARAEAIEEEKARKAAEAEKRKAAEEARKTAAKEARKTAAKGDRKPAKQPKAAPTPPKPAEQPKTPSETSKPEAEPSPLASKIATKINDFLKDLESGDQAIAKHQEELAKAAERLQQEQAEVDYASPENLDNPASGVVPDATELYPSASSPEQSLTRKHADDPTEDTHAEPVNQPVEAQLQTTEVVAPIGTPQPEQEPSASTPLESLFSPESEAGSKEYFLKHFTLTTLATYLGYHDVASDFAYLKKAIKFPGELLESSTDSYRYCTEFHRYWYRHHNLPNDIKIRDDSRRDLDVGDPNRLTELLDTKFRKLKNGDSVEPIINIIDDYWREHRFPGEFPSDEADESSRISDEDLIEIDRINSGLPSAPRGNAALAIERVYGEMLRGVTSPNLLRTNLRHIIGYMESHNVSENNLLILSSREHLQALLDITGYEHLERTQS